MGARPSAPNLAPSAVHAGPLRLRLVPENDATATQIVRRDLDGDPVTLQDANAKPPHIAAERREHGMPVGQQHTKRRIREYLGDLSLELYRLFLGHVASTRGSAPLVSARATHYAGGVARQPPCAASRRRQRSASRE